MVICSLALPARTLTADEQSACAAPGEGITAWWPGDGTFANFITGAADVRNNGVEFGAGEVHQAFLFGHSGDFVKVSSSPATDLGVGNGMTVECWIKPADTAQQHPIVEWNSGRNYGVHFYLSVIPPYGTGQGCLYADIRDTNGTDHWLTSAPGAIHVDEFQHVAMTYDKSNGEATLFRNGVIVAQQQIGIFVPQTTYDLLLGFRPPGFEGAPFTFLGIIDELSLYQRALSATEIGAIYNAGSAGKCPDVPSSTKTYDLRADWSDASNPNKPWAFWSGDSLLPAVQDWKLDRFNPPQPGWAFGDTIPFWFRSVAIPAPGPDWSTDWLPGDILVHTHTPGTPNGVRNGLASVTWTSPTNGVVDIAGAVWEARDIADNVAGGLRGNRWNLYLRGALLSSGVIGGGDPYSREIPFPLSLGSGGPESLRNLPVTAGDMVRLEFVPTGVEGDYVGVQLAITTGPGTPLPGLTAYWRFDETDGALAHDSAGSINGVLNEGAVFIQGGVSGRAVALRRELGGLVNMGNKLDLVGTDFSIALWMIMGKGDTTPNSLLVSKHDAGYNNGYFIDVNTSNAFIGQPGKASFFAGNAFSAPTSTTSVNDGCWHHIVAVHQANGDNVLYVDGVRESAAPAESVAPSPAPFLVGGALFAGTPEGHFTGQIDELQVYSRALSPDEVERLYGIGGLPSKQWWVSTVAGSGAPGNQDGPGLVAQFNRPNGGYVGPDHAAYIADTGNHSIRRFDISAGITTTFAGSGLAGAKDGPGETAQFSLPLGTFVDGAGNVFVADTGNNQIRKIVPNQSRDVSTYAGSGARGYQDGPAATAQFDFPNDLVMDAAGNLYVSEFDNHTIRKVSPDGTVSTFVGNGKAGFNDGAGTEAGLNQPAGLAIDNVGNLYVSEWGSHRIRKVTAAGVVSTLAGSVFPGFKDGQGVQAQFYLPDGLAVGMDGSLFVADNGNHSIRRISPSGTVTTWAGSGASGYLDGPPRAALFNGPGGLGIDAAGNLIVADTQNHRVRQIALLSLPEVILEPARRTATVGSRVDFLPRVTGSGQFAYGWKHNGQDIPGATGFGLTLANVQLFQAGSYSVVVSNAIGSVESAASQLTVVTPIQFERSLPNYYAPGATISVRLESISGTNVFDYAYAVEEFPPANWAVGKVSEGGIYDGVNHKVKFGPFFDTNRRVLTYEVTPPASETGTKTFKGVTSSDGAEAPVVGKETLPAAPLHPADLNPADQAISVNELTAYSAAWRRGTTWAVGPNPVPIDYVTRAGLIWKNGERYHFEPAINQAPLWWVTNSAPAPAFARLATAREPGSAIRLLPTKFSPGEAFSVHVVAKPDSSISAYAVEELVPESLTILNVSGGEYDAANRLVKWGPFFDHMERNLEYSAACSQPSVRFIGRMSLDGVSVSTGGADALPPIRLLFSLNSSTGAELVLDGVQTEGNRYLVETSADLKIWTPLTVVTNQGGPLLRLDRESLQAPQKFYRMTTSPAE